MVEPAYTSTSFDANLIEPDAKLEAYHQARVHVAARIKEALADADAPSVAADAVLEAATAAHPKLRYAAGRRANGLRLLRRFAPASVVDAGIRKNLRLDAQPVPPLEPGRRDGRRSADGRPS